MMPIWIGNKKTFCYNFSLEAEYTQQKSVTTDVYEKVLLNFDLLMKWKFSCGNLVEDIGQTLLTISVHFNLQALSESTRLTLIPAADINETIIVLFAHILHVAPDASLEKAPASITAQDAVVLATGSVSAHTAIVDRLAASVLGKMFGPVLLAACALSKLEHVGTGEQLGRVD
ncbi:hypothetical protein BpHYR1_013190 [Brachionus plicatilis]|uniref:Uncharacterized protein n=1 Tax=Brachionus plicatilis TaxID=10195 RepID=A0A3M7QTH6_BRAPC|nr:hypothetical protein BpHYR1_013190 [Brachionus plicatilis]